MSTHFVSWTFASILLKRLTFFLTCLTFYFLSLLQTVWPISFLFCFLEPHVILHGAGYIPNKKVSTTNIWKKGLRPVSFLEPLWICFNNIIDFVFRDCFVPRYIGSNMDMVKLDSMEDFFSLPLTSWNIRQPAGSSASSNFFSSNFLSHQHSY